jgi:chromosome segregation ATPase
VKQHKEQQWRRQLVRKLDALCLKLSQSSAAAGVADSLDREDGTVMAALPLADDLFADAGWRSHGMARVKECVREMAVSIDSLLGDLVAARGAMAVGAEEARSRTRELEEARRRLEPLESDLAAALGRQAELEASSRAHIEQLKGRLAEEVCRSWAALEEAKRASEARLEDVSAPPPQPRQGSPESWSSEALALSSARAAQAEAALASERELSESLGGEVEKLQARLAAIQQDHSSLKHEAAMLAECAALNEEQSEQIRLSAEQVATSLQPPDPAPILPPASILHP